MKKRILSLLLALVVSIGMLPMSAMADPAVPDAKIDGVMYIPEMYAYNIVDTVLEEDGDLVLPSSLTLDGIEEGTALSVYALAMDGNGDFYIKEAPIVDGKFTMDSAFKTVITDPNYYERFYILSTSGSETIDKVMEQLDNGIYSEIRFNILPTNNLKICYEWNGTDIKDLEAIEVGYDEYGILNPVRLYFYCYYEDENGDDTYCYQWNELLNYTSDNPDVVNVNVSEWGSVYVDIEGKGDAALTVFFKDNFWSGFPEVTVNVEVAKGVEEATIDVIDKIRLLPGSANIFDEAAIVAARQAYNGLSEEQQAKVSNYAKLQTLESELETLKASFTGLLYSIGYTPEGAESTTIVSVMDGREEWTGANIGKTVQSIIFKAVTDEEVAKVTVNGADMPKNDNIYSLTLNRPAEHDGLTLYTVELYKEGSTVADQAVTVMLFWSGDYVISYTTHDRNGFQLWNHQVKLYRGESADRELITRAYTPNNTGCSSKHTSYKVANRLSERVWILFTPSYGSYSSDVKIVDSDTGVMVSQRFPTITSHEETVGPEAGEGMELKVGSNLLLAYMWPVNYSFSETTYYRRTEKPTVIALYLDRADDSLSDKVGISSVEVVGDVGGKYELVQNSETNYYVETRCDETGIKATFKMPEVVKFDSFSTGVTTGRGNPLVLTPVSNTVEDGVRTVVCHWGTVSPRSHDPYTEYGGLGRIVTKAEDEVTMGVFEVNFLRPATPADGITDSDLKTLALSSAEMTYEKDGETRTGFDPDVTEYKAAIQPNAANFYITCIAKFASNGAKVTVDGNFVIQNPNNIRQGKSEVYSAYAGMNQVIEIVVTPPQGSTLQPKTYTITVTKDQASSGTPLIKNWEAMSGSHHQLMNPDTTGTTGMMYVSKVGLRFTDDTDGSVINPGMLFRYDNITATGTVDGACTALTINPDIAMSSAPAKFSYTVNGGDKVYVPDIRNSQSTIKGFNIPIPDKGENTIVITITDEAETQIKTHTFKITKAPNATLSALTSEDAVFVGKFNPTIYRMNMLVEPGTETVSVMAIATEPDAVVEFNGVTGTGSAIAEGLVIDTEYVIDVSYGGQTYSYYLTLKERQAISANRVWAVMPAPGQFVNEHSQTVTGTAGAQGWGDGWDTTLYGATPEQAGRSNYAQPGFSLGWFGGFITYEFDEPVLNSENNLYGIDFTVYGNAFYGNSEPAGVQVSQDGSTWYTLAGSQHYNPDTVWDYEVTYFNPLPDFDPYMSINIPWRDNKGNGDVFLGTAGYHPQPCYPVEGNYLFEGNNANSIYSSEKLTLSGTKIADSNTAYWGYADTHPNSIDIFDKPGNPYRTPGINGLKYAEGSDYGDGFDISWAVDENGKPVELDYVKYIKVYTALAGYSVGEISPEITSITRTTGEAQSVGTTEAPVITVNGRTLKLTEGIYCYDVPMSGTIEVSATLEDGFVWINNEYKGSLREENVSDGRIVRVLAQKGESQPVIYYLTMVRTAAGDQDIVEVENMIAAIGEVTLAKERQINAARTAYRVLPAGMQYLVSNYDVLVAAEAALWRLKDDVEEVVEETITVSMRLIGAELAKEDVDFGVAEIIPEYVTWIATTTYTLKKDSLVYDLFIKAMNNAGLNQIGASNDYVSTIYAPEGYRLSEFTNGKRSGWMYTINGDHPGYGLRYQNLKDGDAVIWHYVNDYAYEVHDWFNEEQWPSLGDGRFYSRWLMAPDYVGGKGGSLDGTENISIPDSEINADEGTILTPKATVTGDTATTVVGLSDMNNAVENAKKDKSTAITVKPEITDSAEKTIVEVPKASVSAIAEKTNADLRVDTPVGTVTIPNDALTSIANEAKGSDIEVSIAKKSAADVKDENIDTSSGIVISVSISSDGKEISSFGGKSITIDIPVSNEFETGETYSVVHISKNGSTETIKGKCIKIDGKLYVRISVTHLSTFVVLLDDVVLAFTDLNKHWAVKEIKYVYAKGIMKGTSETTFEPRETLSRAMLVTMLYRLEKEPKADSKNIFTDVKKGMWYTDAICWAASNGIVNGYGEGIFAPNDSITREQMATILYRYAQYKNYDVSKTGDLTVFSDKKEISEWALGALKWANGEKLINGRTRTGIVPAGNTTRAEAAVMLTRFMKNVVK